MVVTPVAKKLSNFLALNTKKLCNFLVCSKRPFNDFFESISHKSTPKSQSKTQSNSYKLVQTRTNMAQTEDMAQTAVVGFNNKVTFLTPIDPERKCVVHFIVLDMSGSIQIIQPHYQVVVGALLDKFGITAPVAGFTMGGSTRLFGAMEFVRAFMLKHPNLTMGKQVIVTDGFDNVSTVDHKGNADGGVVGIHIRAHPRPQHASRRGHLHGKGAFVDEWLLLKPGAHQHKASVGGGDAVGRICIQSTDRVAVDRFEEGRRRGAVEV